LFCVWSCSGDDVVTFDGGTGTGDGGGMDGAREIDGGDDDGGATDGGDTDGGDLVADGGLTCATDCSELDDGCTRGRCNAATGACETEPAADGTSCDDGSLCTTADVCGSGTCGGTALDCSSMTDMCNTGACDEATGACVRSALPLGTACDDGNACTTTDECTRPRDSPSVCAGMRRSDCAALGDACNAGICDPATGACGREPMPDGTACDDSSACTVGDSCRAGVCSGTVDCSSFADACHSAACDAGTRTCRRTRLADGTTCSDGAACTTMDRCTGGVCGGTPVDCSSMSGTCSVASCAPASGACVVRPTPGAPCDDGNACTSEMCGLLGTCEATLVCREPTDVVPHGAPSRPPLRGVTTMVELSEDWCGEGRVLVGISGEIRADGGYIGRIRAACRDLVLTGSGAGPYTVTTASPGLGPTRGTSGGGGTFSASCPASQVVVGFGGRSGGAVDQLTLRCAPLTVRATPTEWVVDIGAVTTTMPVGGTGGVAFPTTDCAAGHVAVLMRVHAGDAVEAFGLTCNAPRLSYPVRFSAPAATAQMGGAGGTAFADSCGPGRALTGYTGALALGGWHGTMAGLCRAIEVVGPVASPSVITRGVAYTPPRGTMGDGVSWSSDCPPGEIVAGFSGRAALYVDQITLRCTSLTVTGSSIAAGVPIGRPPIGGMGGTPFPATDCAAGAIATQARGRSFDYIDAFALGCSAATW
jgi:hypothetical protein